jgi:hypothetical protein
LSRGINVATNLANHENEVDFSPPFSAIFRHFLTRPTAHIHQPPAPSNGWRRLRFAGGPRVWNVETMTTQPVRRSDKQEEHDFSRVAWETRLKAKMPNLPHKLPILIARGDAGPLTVTPTRWSPRKVRCQEPDGQQRLYAVKYMRDATSAAALISEVVSVGILDLIGVSALDPALVEAADGWTTPPTDAPDAEEASIFPGLHFGTRLRLDLFPAQMDRPEQVTWERFADPLELIGLWAADCYLMNLDRRVLGNVLLEEAAGHAGRYHLVAADQSDCFLGAGSLADGSFSERSRRAGAMAYPHEAFTPRALAEPGGLARLEAAITAVERSGAQMDAVLDRVPADWWRRSGVDPETVRATLSERAGRIREIVGYEQWRSLDELLAGGQLLGERERGDS